MERAFIFDLNGTMINDMHFHIKAWHHILNSLGANISMERMKEECYGKNQELLERIFPGRFSLEEKNSMSFEKERQYQIEFRPHLKLITGLEEFLMEARQLGIPMAIGSAAILYNIDFVLDGLDIRHYFSAIVSADDVENSKPDPETFLKCAARLGMQAEQCIVFEDSPKGVDAAARAGMKTVVLTTMHSPQDFNKLDGILLFTDDFSSLDLNQLKKGPL